MLKWFRKYNKFILVVGAAFLMVAFLVPQAAEWFVPKPTDEPIGTVDGVKRTIGDRRQASAEVQVLGQIYPDLAMLSGGDSLQWMLMLEEAHQMGISASDYEVADLLAQVDQLREQQKQPKVDKARLAAQYGATEPFIDQAIRNWLIVQQYKELVYGLAHINEQDRILNLRMFTLYQRFRMFGQAVAALESTMGKVRVSQPLLERFVSDQNANVKIAFVEVNSDQYKEKVARPTEEKLKDLFDKYKGNLAGAGEKYGYGYKLPNRVKLEYIAIPIKRVREAVKIAESDIVEHYDKNKDQYTETPPTPAEDADKKEEDKTPPAPARQKTYDEVRDQIEGELRRQRAGELARKMVQRARNLLIEDARRVKINPDGYRDIEAATKSGWKPKSLRDVADALNKEFSVLPDYHYDDQKWFDAASLANLEGIGSSVLVLGTPPNQRVNRFAEYALSAKELNPDKRNPLNVQRLQANMPSMAMEDFDQSRHLFRITDAQEAHEPKTLDVVRTQVEKDAIALASYETLLQEKDTWLKRVRTEGFDKLAEELKVSLLKPQPFSKRQTTPDGRLSVPDVVTVGPSEEFVNAIFKIAERVDSAGGVDKASIDDRTEAISLDDKRNLYLVRLDEYSPITRSQFDSNARNPQVVSWIQQSLAQNVIKDGKRPDDPLAIEQLAKRVNFLNEEGKRPKPEGEEDEEKEEKEEEEKNE